MSADKQGYVHIYTGDGKGKTCSALGLALRMAGAGNKVFLAQFVKSMAYSEIETISKHLPMIEHQLYGISCFIKRKATPKDKKYAQAGLKEVSKIIHSKQYQLVILDEINIALYYDFVSSISKCNFLGG